ncbi:HNH endonuclease [Georgenia sp. TF02-10]|nr:HNH endonuclease [Georgenia sp. TF02-10]
MLLAHREDGGWGTGQDRDFADWRSRTTGGGRGAATGELVVAEGMAEIPALQDAVARGELGLEHAKALARVRQGASGPVKEALSGDVGAELVEKGKGLSAPDLAREARRVAAQIDAAAAQADFEAVWQRRSVTTRRSGGAATGQWVLDPVSGAVVATALDAIVGVPGKEDTRTREQRLADALVTMASRVLQVGADLNGAQVRPHLAVVVQEETWAATTAHRRAQEAADQGAAFGLTTPHHEDDDTGCVRVRPALPAVVGLPDVAPGELEDGTVVPLGELGRLLCDCEATRVVLDAASVVLDVGQSQRTYTGELRRAVTTRDRRCRWPGCTVRASWCEVHHVRWWSHGGATSVANGMTLCSFHHHVLHAQHVLVVPGGEGFAFYHRDGHLIGTSPHPPRGPRSTRRAPVADGYTPDLTGTRQHLTDPLNNPRGRAPDPPTRVDGRPGLAPGGPGGLPDGSRGQPDAQGTALPTSPGPGGRAGPDPRATDSARPHQASTSAEPMLWDDPAVT